MGVVGSQEGRDPRVVADNGVRRRGLKLPTWSLGKKGVEVRSDKELVTTVSGR